MSKLRGSTDLLSRNIEASLTEKVVGIEKIAFSSIAEYDDLKRIVIRTLEIKENYNLLFVGPPASAKILFLRGIRRGIFRLWVKKRRIFRLHKHDE
jgi:hypothetical protein